MTVLRIGTALSQSGIYARQGQQALHGLQLWVDETNAQGGLFVPELHRAMPLQLIAYDDRSRRHDVEQLTERLISVDRRRFPDRPLQQWPGACGGNDRGSPSEGIMEPWRFVGCNDAPGLPLVGASPHSRQWLFRGTLFLPAQLRCRRGMRGHRPAFAVGHFPPKSLPESDSTQNRVAFPPCLLSFILTILPILATSLRLQKRWRRQTRL